MKKGDVRQQTSPLFSTAWWLLNYADALCCRTLLSLYDFELDLLAVGKRAETLFADGAEVDENIPSVSAFDEANALGIVEPFHGSRLAICLCVLSL